MDIFQTHADIVRDYHEYIESFIRIKDERISQAVKTELDSGKLWPEPLIQFNPAFEPAGSFSLAEAIQGILEFRRLHIELDTAIRNKCWRLFGGVLRSDRPPSKKLGTFT